MTDFCIGTAQFGMDYGVANKTGQPPQTEIDQIVKYAIDHGIMYFDTAQSYGQSELNLGSAIGKLKDRDNINVVSKLSPSIKNNSIDGIIKSVNLSIEKLKINYLYCFMSHRLEALQSTNFLLALDILKKNGSIMKSGVSVYTPDEAFIALENPYTEILQIPLNILDRRWIDLGIINIAKEKNIQLFFRSIFLQGFIFLENDDLKKTNMIWARPFLKEFRKIVDEISITPIELTFRILSSISGKNVIIMGIDGLEQLQSNIKLINSDDIDLDVIDTWWEKIPEFPDKLLNPTLWS